MNDERRCPHCDKPIPHDALYCPLCGAGPPQATGSSAGSIVAGIAIGLVVALPIWYLLSMFGLQVFGGFDAGQPPRPHQEFYVPVGPIAFFTFMALLTVGGLIIQARMRLSSFARALVITFCSATLGLFLVCDAVSISMRGG